MQVTSKAFRCTLPRLTDAQLERLQRWTSENCASGLAFREDGGVVWLACRERAKTKESFLRSAGRTLRILGIDTGTLRGRWLSLAAEEVVHAELARQPGSVAPAREAECADELPESPADDGERLVVLPSAPRRNSVPVTVAKA